MPRRLWNRFPPPAPFAALAGPLAPRMVTARKMNPLIASNVIVIGMIICRPIMFPLSREVSYRKSLSGETDPGRFGSVPEHVCPQCPRMEQGKQFALLKLILLARPFGRSGVIIRMMTDCHAATMKQ